MTTPICPRCGAPLPGGALVGACPACLLRGAITSGQSPTAVLERIGEYRLLELIGEGGMGQVYLCEQEGSLRRRAALKIIKLGMDSHEVIARFEAERQALALMEHPNIAHVFDAGTSPDGRSFFVMEYVPGIPLTEYCDRQRLGTEARLRLFLQVCDAIQHAHQKGVIHRDLKPSNVLVMVQEERPIPKVIDFGVAKAVHGRLIEGTLFTRHGLVLGTPEYMSPEQAESDALDVDTRTDIYSLGVLLYELLVGTLPFDAGRLRRAAYQEIQRIIREDEPPRPSKRLTDLGQGALVIADHRHTNVASLQKELRGDLDWVTLKAMEKDRTRRYPSASELSADITRHLDKEPVTARPQSATYRIRKFAQRHRVLVTSMVTIAIVMLSAAIVSSLFFVRAEKARRETRAALVDAYVSGGMKLVDEGDHLAALPWLVQALKLEDGGVEREEVHRLRIGTLLSQAPRLVQLWAHDKDIYSARFSNDGRLVATASADKTARVWDVTTGKPLADSLRHDGEVLTAEFSADGTRLVTASADGTARIWDVRTGDSSGPALQHGAAVYRAVFSADGQYVATASADRTARVWSAATGQVVMTVYHDDEVLYVSFSGDGREIVTASLDGTARRWNVPTGASAGFTALNHSRSGVNVAAFSPDGRQILTSGRDGYTRLWDRATQRLLAEVRHERNRFAAFNVDGSRFVTAGGDRSARIWETATGLSVARVRLNHEHDVTDAQFQPGGNLIATSSGDGKVRLWDSTTGVAVGTILRHVGVIRSVRFDPKGRYVLTAGRDGTARLWDLAAGSTDHVITSQCADAFAIRFSQDGNTLAGGGTCSRLWDTRTGDARTPPIGYPVPTIMGRTLQQFSRDLSRVIVMDDQAARVWNVTTGQPSSERMVPGKPLTAVAMTSDGHVAVTGTGKRAWFGLLPGRPPSGPGEAQLWDVNSGKPIGQKMPHDETVVLAVFSPDGRRMATATEKGMVRIWDARTGGPVTPKLPTTYTGAGLVAVAFSGDGERVATGADDGTVQVWSASKGELLVTFSEHSNFIVRLAFSRDGGQLLSASTDGTARLWDLRRGKQQGPAFRHQGYVMSTTFSPDGRWIVTGSTDKTSRVWDARTGAAVTSALPHAETVLDVAFAPDNRRFATAARTIRIWQLSADKRPLEELESFARLLAGYGLDGVVPVPLTNEGIRRDWSTVGEGVPRSTASPNVPQ